MDKKRFLIKKCKKDEYLRAWNQMYSEEKDLYNKNKLYDGINPSLLKKPLNTELDNFCVVAYDRSIECAGFPGKPVGIFCLLSTKAKLIGKPLLVNPNYFRQGLGKALFLVNEKQAKENGFDWYYAGCSHCSAGILTKYWGLIPYSSSEEHDMYKFNIDLNRDNFDELYKKYVLEKEDLEVQ